MATSDVQSVSTQLKQLNEARKAVLSDPTYYSSIMGGILPLAAPNSPPELRRWATDFIAEAFATPMLPGKDKEVMSFQVMTVLRGQLENPKEDPYVLKSAIQASASIYPYVMRWIIHNPYERSPWDDMVTIKQKILRLWDGAASAVKLCCIKFAQRVVLAQTTAVNMDKRNGLEVSLGMVPAGHPFLDPRQLEAEATGLLDRILGVLQDNSIDALVVDGTLNCLSILVRTRPSTSNRIMNAVLSFNPLKLANSPMTPKTRVLVKSMEKTTRMLLIHILKRDPHNPYGPRIQQHVERLMRSRAEILDDMGRKRALAEQQAPYGDAKRQKMTSEPAPVRVNPLAPGPNSLAAIYTLTQNVGLQAFDATQVPSQIATKVVVSTLARVDPHALAKAVHEIRERLAAKEAAQAPVLNPETAPLDVEEDDDDYEPDFTMAEDEEQIKNKLDGKPREEEQPRPDAGSLALGPYKLPRPPPLNPEAAAAASQMVVARVFDAVRGLEEPAAKKTRGGINRLAASSYDKESILTFITRLGTRATAGLENIQVKDEDSQSLAITSHASSDAVRERLYAYVLEDFRKRIDIGVSWLCEEWYCDNVQKKQNPDAPLHYDKWAMRLVDGFFPYLNPSDKVLTRFLGEMPELNPAILAKVKRLCGDPSMVQLALTSLLYLVMMKPPVRAMALDSVQDIWIEYEDARPMAAKYLTKWRPGFIESQSGGGGVNDAALPPAVAT
ncbi:mRNA cleavage and polyadenylation specificity factor complex subunit pta1 [Cytospora mali]|uniref:mRNA cleavage and polyadenylation specificity factor complex subunit pta1 n=1 Tax=Cytospora mali TaxID=578113 RepID=A0A194VQU0_CYTMA|nr:mRNA cleavage and polyadenylation specificity factor complex subunit pta1 [Valsa mali]